MEEAPKAEPESLEVLIEPGRANPGLNALAGTIAATEKLVELDANHGDAFYIPGAVHGNTGGMEKAKALWRRPGQAAPESDSGR